MEEPRVIPTTFWSSGELVRGNFVMPPGTGPFPGICKFHGLPGSPDQVHGIAWQLALAGFAVLTFDFRGFRRSEGFFSLSSEVEDARNAVTHLQESSLTTEGWVGVYGASFGGAVAVLAAAQDKRINAVCLRAPVYDTAAFVRSPIFSQGVEQLQLGQIHGMDDPQTRARILEQLVEESVQLNPFNEIDSIAPRPLFITTGDADKGIDIAGVRRFFEAAKDPKELVIVEGADHNLSDPAAYNATVEAVVSWFQVQRP
ncbi:MAG: alpha/beta hydrolase family protein [Promethearchaeota archaeon]